MPRSLDARSAGIAFVAALLLFVGGSLTVAIAASGGGESHIATELAAEENAERGALDAAISAQEASINELMACLVESGFSIQAVIPADGLRPTRFNFSFPDPDGVPDQQTSSVAQSTYAECAETSGYSAANLAYSDALGRPSATDVDAAYDRIGACVASGGPEDPEPNAMSVFFGFEGHRDLTERTFGLDWSDAEAVETYVQCSLAEEAVSGITAPDPGPPNR